MDQQAALTIAIPTYNRRGSVTALVNALLPQLGPQDELLVSDDGSTDGTESALRAIQRVRYLRSPSNQGMVGNWNACLAAAERDWVCLVHDDDRVSPGALDTLRRGIAEARGPALVGFKGVGNDVDTSFRCQLVEPGPWAALNSLMIPSGVAVHRDIIQAVGRFEVRFTYSTDIEYFARICARYRSVIIQNPTVVEYQMHDNNYQYRTWRQPDFFAQLEEIERAVVAHSGLTSAIGERSYQTRMAGHLTHMFFCAARQGDRQVLMATARRLRDNPNVDWKVRQRARVAAVLGWLPNLG